MGQIQGHPPVLMIVAVISRHDHAHQWAQEKLIEVLGPVAKSSEFFEFTETSFYEASMGAGLTKRFLAFEHLSDPEILAELKRKTNGLEMEYASSFDHEEERPLNLDPGYITEAKLILATTKDRDHRIYLGGGIFAEVTLHYKRSGWSKSRWTYPNYQRTDFHEFFTLCREHLRSIGKPT